MCALLAFAAGLLLVHLGSPQHLCDGPGRFSCGDGTCISKVKVCNGIRECPKTDADESNCSAEKIAMMKTTCFDRRDWAESNNYTCRKPCNRRRDCKGFKRCLCDDECGRSCYNPATTCDEDPPMIPNARVIVKYNRSNVLKPAVKPYRYGYVAVYKCNDGYRLEGSYLRCNAKRQWSSDIPKCMDMACRGNVPEVPNTIGYRIFRVRKGYASNHAHEAALTRDKVLYRCRDGLRLNGNPPVCLSDNRWSQHTARCEVPCNYERDNHTIEQYNLQCGSACGIPDDCDIGTVCKCDGPCSRTCVSIDADCLDAPPGNNAILTYEGEGSNRIARYQCNDGFYLHSGNTSLRCTGSSVWIGSPPDCRPVRCGYPYESIQGANGIVSNINGRGYGNTSSFECEGERKLFGSPKRICMGNGLWSGYLAVCDYPVHPGRCRHPGVPINGRLYGSDFSVGSRVNFECDEDYLMFGGESQICQEDERWSDGGAPICRYFRYPQIKEEVVQMFTQAMVSMPDQTQSLGRTIDINDDVKQHNIFFVIDVSASVKTADLEDELTFAQRLVNRMRNFGKKVNYAVVIYASQVMRLLSILDEKSGDPDHVNTMLNGLKDAAVRQNYTRSIHTGTATSKALADIEYQMAVIRVKHISSKSHIFFFTDGKHTEGESPGKKRQDLQNQFGDEVEFYSITAVKNPNKHELAELKGLATKRGKTCQFIKIDDYYKLQIYLDEVTNFRVDYSKCGRAGDIGEAVDKTTVSLGRTFGGHAAKENAWPWHAAIVDPTDDESPVSKIQRTTEDIVGGGSILNNKWVLTAAHIFETNCGNRGKRCSVFVGLFHRTERRREHDVITGYTIANVTKHPDYNSSSFQHDIALIKIGNRINVFGGSVPDEASFTFGDYIRPICLPCTGTCVTQEHIDFNNGKGVNRCEKEESILLKSGSKTIVTGVGHQEHETIKKYDVKISEELHQVLLVLGDENQCRNGLKILGDSFIFNENNICTTSKTDACKGDSGGPMVREVEDHESGISCWVQTGIVSFGLGCGTDDNPGYFTNVIKYIPWINETINGTLSGP